jgi:glycosyltransferase involved in cell wall biosynthesis
VTALPLSAVLITRDAADHLDRVLTAVADCDEILVLDSGSTDATRDIAHAHGATWHEHAFAGYGEQKRRAVALARHDWIVSVDADEVLDEDARAALLAIDWLAVPWETCWRIRRRPFIGRREIRHGHWVPDLPVRVFHRGVHSFGDDAVHEGVRPKGPVQKLDGSLLHYSYPDLAALFRPEYHRRKMARYRGRGRSASGPVLLLRAAGVFLRSYVLRRGFLDGPAGLVVALAGSVSAVTGLAMASDPTVAPQPPAEAA